MIIKLTNDFNNEDTLIEYLGKDDTYLKLTKICRSYLLSNIIPLKDIAIREFSDYPIMKDNDKIKTSEIIIRCEYGNKTIDEILSIIEEFPNKKIILENPFFIKNISQQNWDDKIDQLKDKITKIQFSNLNLYFNAWQNDENIQNLRTYIDYCYPNNSISDIDLWKYPFKHIIEKYWEDFTIGFVLEDYEMFGYEFEYIYYLNGLYMNSYTDSLVINLNYKWNEKKLESLMDSINDFDNPLFSLRLRTIPLEKNLYYNEDEANLDNDENRIMGEEDSKLFFNTYLKTVIDNVYTNSQFCGIELDDGYFGNEGYILPECPINNLSFNDYIEYISSIIEIDPMLEKNDMIERICETEMFCIIKN